MRRLFKFKNRFNWKYTIGEILLIFIGINLAIWFNDWNASKKSNQSKEIAIEKIKEEIQNNVGQLSLTQKNTNFILNAFSDYEKVYHNSSSEIITSSEQFNALQKKYPNFYRLKDSVGIEADLFHYRGQTFIDLEVGDLSEIAWETTRSINITHEFDYECLYDLESMYNLQRRTQAEINKSANALQKRDLKELRSILEFLRQLESQLMDDYESILESIENCR